MSIFAVLSVVRWEPIVGTSFVEELVSSYGSIGDFRSMVRDPTNHANKEIRDFLRGGRLAGDIRNAL